MSKILQTNRFELERIAEEVQNCTKCRLWEKRENAVPGEGAPDAEILLIGEGPGGKEDQEGRPFVGRAGEFLEELLSSVNLSREDIFITNIVKCRPPNNRAPRKDEIRACKAYFQRQIEIIQPKVIGTLGNHATETLLGETGMGRLHGKKFEYKRCVLIPMYHPVASLYNPQLKAEMKEDMNRLVETFHSIPSVDEAD